jgi:aminoglycoside phosphotransferase (APT) family kinase protein
MADEPGPLLASGRAADVYDIGDDKVLRRYRGAHGDVEHEARIMTYVAERRFPVPKVYEAGGTDIVMDRVDGVNMLESLEAAPWKVVWHARLLAKLQRKLAKIEAPDWMLAANADASHRRSVLHLDLHPMNVMLSPRHGPIVIDWTNAGGGPEAFDAALTYVEIVTYETTGARDQIGQRVFAESFKRFRRVPHFDAFVGVACDHRLADKNLTPDERVAVAALRKKIKARHTTQS